MAQSLKIAVVGWECIACGCCARVCPREAIAVEWGIAARVDAQKCVGCGKCAKVCPAAVIDLVKREKAE